MHGEPVAAPVPVQRSTAPNVVAALPALDRLADLARRLLGAAGSQVRLAADSATGAAPLVTAGARTGVLGEGTCDALCTLTAASRSALAVPDASLDPRFADLPSVRAGTFRSYLGVPLLGKGGALGALCVHDPAPRTWDETDAELLSQLAASVVAELQLEAIAGAYQQSVERWELAIDAAGVGSFDWDLVTGQLLWDDRLLSLFGYAADDFGRSIEDFEARLHHDDVARVRRVLAAAVEDCDSWAMEYRVALPDGRVRWITARGRALRGPSGAAERMLGAAYDSTDVHESQARTAHVLETMSAAFYSLDPQWRFTYVNAEAERILGRDRDELLGGVLWELFPATIGSDFEAHYRDAVASGETRTFEAYYPAPLDAWYELRAWPSPDGLSVYFLDVSARRAAQESLQAALRRARLVADVTTELSATLDAEVAVARLAELLVPDLADFCLVTLVDDERDLRDVGWAHADPDLEQITARYSRLRIGGLRSSSFISEALRTGEPVLIERDATSRIARAFEPGEARDLLHVLAPRAATILPMHAHGRTVGLLSLFRSGSGRPYDEDELATARDVATRAALALDNARLFAQQRELAEELQRSLLTPPPERDHLEVVARYVPAARAAQVGGDWYDAFLQPTGATMLVIGDVVGHDTAAAAAMGQVRGLLRGIAYTTEQGPADVLTRLDHAIEGLQIGTNATAVVARLEQTEQERDDGVTHLRWSNAGHPPPMVLDADGAVRVLSGSEADLLLGLDPASPRGELRTTLGRDSTVLLYTDGLVERRGQNLDEGIERLRATLAGLRHLPLDELCDELLHILLPPVREDDVAMVVVRLHWQDERPPA